MPIPASLNAANFRLFVYGQLFSLPGAWMQHVAMIWLAWRLGGSAALLGLVGFAGQIPILLFSAVAGVWNDRLDRRRLLLLTQTLAMLQALLLFALTVMQLTTPAVLIALAFMLGCINAFDLPARQAFLAQLVHDKKDLPGAIGMHSLLMNGSRFVGPALAGVVISSFGEAACFLLNAISFLAILAALAVMRVAPPAPSPRQTTWRALRAGLRHVREQKRIRLCLQMLAAFSFLVTPYAILMPVFAASEFDGDAGAYSMLIASAGLGSLLAAAWLTLRGGFSAGGLDRLTAGAVLGSGVLLAAFATTPTLLLASPLLAALGCCAILTVAGSNTLIQGVVGEEYRGRVMAIFSTAFLGVAPLGNLAVGAVAELVGVRAALFGCGLLTAVLGLIYRRRLVAATAA